ncbi:MAG TPA: prephenate dehydratase [Pirellulales bacterium]|jgi:chorismate mutase/prephenate dehydratase|nr:prephenate dehydratase [Pirellulales bacterium]
MSKDSAARAAKKTTPRGENEAATKAQIDRLDRDLVKLINQRTKLASLLGKQNHSAAAVHPPEPEPEAIVKALAQNKGPVSQECLRAIFRELIGGAKALQRTLRVAVLGPAYSYSHLAALERFAGSVEYLPVGSISAVFEEVNRGHATFGVVPIENSTDGRIADTLDMFTRLRVRICGEVQLRIQHYLLGKCPRADVTEVYSRPQALSQCRNWLLKHLPAARPIEVTSTATAAQLAQDKQGAAAIASVQAGIHYGLDVLAEKVEDNPANITRFAIIGDESAPRTGHDKTALMFEVAHRPGSLADAIAIFKRLKLNLTWIESFPIPQTEGHYLFFVELDGHESDGRVKKALAALGRKALRLEVLGAYPRSPIA